MILRLSAEQVAGRRTPGKASGEIRHHGSQSGRVKLADRAVRVKRPRLRHKTEGEVKIPAYEALREDRGLGQHILGALLRGVSTREYHEVLPKMAATVGVSRSAISRQAKVRIPASSCGVVDGKHGRPPFGGHSGVHQVGKAEAVLSPSGRIVQVQGYDRQVRVTSTCRLVHHLFSMTYSRFINPYKIELRTGFDSRSSLLE